MKPFYETARVAITGRNTIFKDVKRYTITKEQLKSNDSHQSTRLYRRFMRLKPFVSSSRVTQKMYSSYVKQKWVSGNPENLQNKGLRSLYLLQAFLSDGEEFKAGKRVVDNIVSYEGSKKWWGKKMRNGSKLLKCGEYETVRRLFNEFYDVDF